MWVLPNIRRSTAPFGAVSATLRPAYAASAADDLEATSGQIDFGQEQRRRRNTASVRLETPTPIHPLRWPEARSFRQLGRFRQVINADRVFGTYNPGAVRVRGGRTVGKPPAAHAVKFDGPEALVARQVG